MSRRFVTIHSGRRIPLGAYIAAVRLAKANPDAEFRESFCGWWPATGREIVEQWRRGIWDRINSGVPRCAHWPECGAGPRIAVSENRTGAHLMTGGHANER